jgi:NADPH:quinone reductase-like Zn-dependent oxidoreductase
MQGMKLKAPGGLDKLELASIEPRPPGPGEVQVAIKVSALNFHDYLVVSGLLPTEDGRIPMSDGAGSPGFDLNYEASDLLSSNVRYSSNASRK